VLIGSVYQCFGRLNDVSHDQSFSHHTPTMADTVGVLRRMLVILREFRGTSCQG
jgi:hypothetical protein